MRNRRLRRPSPGPGAAPGRTGEAGVPGLRQCRHLDGLRGQRRVGALSRQPVGAAPRRRRRRRRIGGRRLAHRHHGDRPHALGHPRPGLRRERPSALRHRQPGAHRAQRDRGELRLAARATDRPGLRLHLGDRRRGRRPPGLGPLRGRSHRRRPRGLRRAGGPLRVRGAGRGRARPPGGRSQGVPADRGPGRGRAVLRLRHPRLPARDPARAVHQRRRDRHAGPRGRALPDRRRQASGARGRGDRLGRRDRGEGRLRDVHAQGDPRAGRRARRDGRRPRSARARG